MERAVLGDVVVSVPALRPVPRAGPRARSRTRYVLVRRSRSALLAWYGRAAVARLLDSWKPAQTVDPTMNGNVWAGA